MVGSSQPGSRVAGASSVTVMQGAPSRSDGVSDPTGRPDGPSDLATRVCTMPVDLASLVTPEHTAIVTSEVQNGVVGERSVLPQLAEAAQAGMVPTLRKLLPVARAAGVQVVHCTAYRRADGRG